MTSKNIVWTVLIILSISMIAMTVISVVENQRRRMKLKSTDEKLIELRSNLLVFEEEKKALLRSLEELEEKVKRKELGNIPKKDQDSGQTLENKKENSDIPPKSMNDKE